MGNKAEGKITCADQNGHVEDFAKNCPVQQFLNIHSVDKTCVKWTRGRWCDSPN